MNLAGESALRRSEPVPFSSILLAWRSNDGQRVLTVHGLEPSEPFGVDYFFRTLGDTVKQRELCLRIREPHSSIDVLEKCLEVWILSEQSADPERLISAYLDERLD